MTCRAGSGALIVPPGQARLPSLMIVPGGQGSGVFPTYEGLARYGADDAGARSL